MLWDFTFMYWLVVHLCCIGFYHYQLNFEWLLINKKCHFTLARGQKAGCVVRSYFIIVFNERPLLFLSTFFAKKIIHELGLWTDVILWKQCPSVTFHLRRNQVTTGKNSIERYRRSSKQSSQNTIREYRPKAMTISPARDFICFEFWYIVLFVPEEDYGGLFPDVLLVSRNGSIY